jgi:hypothetical protein
MSLAAKQTLRLCIASKMRHHVEILLTQKGIKPRTGIHHHTATRVFIRLQVSAISAFLRSVRVRMGQ